MRDVDLSEVDKIATKLDKAAEDSADLASTSESDSAYAGHIAAEATYRAASAIVRALKIIDVKGWR